MSNANFLRDSLKAAATATLNTCKLCGAIINRPYEDAHDQFHQATYEPFAADTPGAVAQTCKLCGILINRSYQDQHNRGHG